MMFFFQLSREAGLRLPQPIGQSMSIVGALILGDATVSASLTSQSTMVVVGGNYYIYFFDTKIL